MQCLRLYYSVYDLIALVQNHWIYPGECLAVCVCRVFNSERHPVSWAHQQVPVFGAGDRGVCNMHGVILGRCASRVEQGVTHQYVASVHMFKITGKSGQ